MKNRFFKSLFAGLVISAIIFIIELVGKRPTFVAVCDGASIAAACLLAAGAIVWINSDHIRRSVFDLSRSFFKKLEASDLPSEDEVKEKAMHGKATLLAGCVWSAVAAVLLAIA